MSYSVCFFFLVMGTQRQTGIMPGRPQQSFVSCLFFAAFLSSFALLAVGLPDVALPDVGLFAVAALLALLGVGCGLPFPVFCTADAPGWPAVTVASSTMIVAGAEPGSKREKAEKLGVPVIDVDGFRRLLAGEMPDAAA